MILSSIKPSYDWAVSARAYMNEPESGDQTLVRPFEDGVLVAVIDALGHGKEAAKTATIAAEIINVNCEKDVVTLMKLCHEKLRYTRGAAISLASFHWHDKLTSWLGVGNVAGTLFSVEQESKYYSAAYTPLLLSNGVVGYNLPNDLHASNFPFSKNTTLIMATDGIRSEFMDSISSALLNPSLQAKQILDNYGRVDDDATVLVFRYNTDF